MSVGLIGYLRNWGESLFTSKKAYIAQQSLPNTQESSITVPNDDTTHATVSPIDGWACMRSDDGNVKNFQLFTNEIHSVISLSTPYWFRGFIPVKKGDVVNYRCFGSGAGAHLDFIRSIGGGLNSIIQAFGGDLWLRLNHSFKRFSSSLVAKQCRVVRTLILQSLRLVNGANNLLLRLTDMLKPTFSTQKRSNSQTLQQPFEQKPKLKFPQGFIFLCIKAINLKHILTTRIRQELISRSSRQSAQANLRLQGGAL